MFSYSCEVNGAWFKPTSALSRCVQPVTSATASDSVSWILKQTEHYSVNDGRHAETVLHRLKVHLRLLDRAEAGVDRSSFP